MCSACVEGQWAIMGCQGTGVGGRKDRVGVGGLEGRGRQRKDQYMLQQELDYISPETDIMTWTLLKPKGRTKVSVTIS